MRTVLHTDAGILELNWMWLPTWIGMNTALKAEVEKSLKNKIVGKPITEESLDEINDLVLDHLSDAFPKIEGLRDYLDGLKFINFKP